MSDSKTEAGQPTQWDIAFREGYAKALREGHDGKPWWSGEPHSETTRNERGEWVLSIPVPLYGLRKMCSCGRKFWTGSGYRGHYALAHVLRLP